MLRSKIFIQLILLMCCCLLFSIIQIHVLVQDQGMFSYVSSRISKSLLTDC